MKLREMFAKSLGKQEQLAEDFKHGKQAEMLIKNDAFIRAFDSVEEKIMQGIINSDWNQGELRESAYNRLKAAQWVKDSLIREIDDGEIAKQRLNK